MCKHINQIFEQHEGFITCTDCGEVLGIYFIQQEDSANNFREECISDIKSYLTECCERRPIQKQCQTRCLERIPTQNQCET